VKQKANKVVQQASEDKWRGSKTMAREASSIYGMYDKQNLNNLRASVLVPIFVQTNLVGCRAGAT
jgi:hypothetical protein